MARLLSFPQAELLPIAVNGGQTPRPQTPKPDAEVPLSDRLSDALREAWFERIIDQLLSAEAGELNPHWRADIRQSRIIVALCRKDDPEPLVSSSYLMYGVHPDLVWTAIQSIRTPRIPLCLLCRTLMNCGLFRRIERMHSFCELVTLEQWLKEWLFSASCCQCWCKMARSTVSAH